VNLPSSADASWPATWRHSHAYDRLEIGDSQEHLGYRLAYRRRVTLAMDLVRRAATPPARVIDIGAAQGNLTLALAEAGYLVTWNDIRPELAGYVQLKHERGAVEYRAGNAFDLNADPAFRPYDVAIATEIIEHVAHPDAFLAALATLVRPGGHAVLTTPNGGYFRNRLPRFSDCTDPSQFEVRQFGPGSDDHIFLLHQDELARLALSAGWLVREVRLCTSFVLSGYCRTEPIIRRLSEGTVERIDGWIQRLPSALLRRVDLTIAVLLERI
jgi:2-polyprenyl-3-methyl-5-hydroxy-6-metoxy-1,4-benzoquinol methylase